ATSQFERSTVRSRSFKKINRALDVLRRTKSGSTVPNHVERERENIENLIASEAASPRLYHLIPDGEITSLKINRRNPHEALAIRVVGGSETPLIHIISKITLVAGEKDENLHIILNKSNPEQQLGIKLIRKANQDGVFVFNLLEGGLAAREGELQENDKVLAINGHDLQHGSPECAAQLIQNREADPLNLSDILLSVNGIDLTGVSRGEAVAHLKNVSSSVVFKALELKACETTEGENGDLLPDANLGPSSQSEWSPSWVMWLELPSCKEIVLRRNTAGSLGFSIVGGYEENSGNKPILIKSIVEGTPAYNDGRIRTKRTLVHPSENNLLNAWKNSHV
ncbi:E3 ubiquitin-protein ligase LNX, partial [Ophiophagus hannah]